MVTADQEGEERVSGRENFHGIVRREMLDSFTTSTEIQTRRSKKTNQVRDPKWDSLFVLLYSGAMKIWNYWKSFFMGCYFCWNHDLKTRVQSKALLSLKENNYFL